MLKDCLHRFIREDQQNVLAKIAKAFLWVLSLVYLIVTKVVIFLHQVGILPKKKLGFPVVSIGNMTLGGTGKTPLAGYVAAYLQEKGFVPAILTRGYKAKQGVADEVLLYQELWPELCIAQGSDRFAAGKKALSENLKINVFVMDDGFQHWALDRDLEIVVVDATDPFGNGFVIPRGTLRESLSALRRADIIVLTKVDLAKENCRNIYLTIKKYNFHAIIVESIYAPIKFVNIKQKGLDRDIGDFKGRDVAIVSAIGNPQGFERIVWSLGCKVTKAFAFEDHHHYGAKDLEKMMQAISSLGIKTLITTQKDAVKLRSLVGCLPQGVDLFALAVSVKITKGEKEFEERIHAILPR